MKKIFEEIMEINFPVLKSKFQIKWVYRASRKDIKKKNSHLKCVEKFRNIRNKDRILYNFKRVPTGKKL